MVMPNLPLDQLRPHPLNKRIYGDTADEALIESVSEHGVLTPLVVTEDGVVVSGHRRLAAAKKLKLEKVPAVVRSFRDALEIEEALISTNEQRQRTIEQKVREFAHLREIEGKRAKERQRDAGARGGEGGRGRRKGKTLRDKVPQRVSGRSREIAAKHVQLSYKTLERGLEVVQHADVLRKAGEREQADQLVALLNTKSVLAAYHALKKPKPEPAASSAAGEPKQEAGGTSRPEELPLGAHAWANTPPDQSLERIVRSMVSARAAYKGDKKDFRGVRDLELVAALDAALEPLHAEARRRCAITIEASGVPVYAWPLGNGVKRAKKFEKKKLATYSFNVGLACGHQCTYCSTPTMNRTHPGLVVLGFSSDDLGYATVDKDSVARMKGDLPRNLKKTDVVEICTTVDAWAPEARQFGLGRQCVLHVLQHSLAQVRILTKNSGILEDLPAFKGYEDRVIVGLSTGMPSSRDDAARAVEPNASSISDRLHALVEAHRMGFRTFGMLCPCLPGLADSREALQQMFDAVLACGVENVWLEPINARRGSIPNTASALRAAGLVKEADAVIRVKIANVWRSYVVDLVRTAQEVAEERAAADKLHVLLYEKHLNQVRAELETRPNGLVWLES